MMTFFLSSEMFVWVIQRRAAFGFFSPITRTSMTYISVSCRNPVFVRCKKQEADPTSRTTLWQLPMGITDLVKRPAAPFSNDFQPFKYSSRAFLAEP
ncbi:hypothetical protein Mapa_011152 [Marchantia paleacea]|nr:hypothetical protein Mapa_011152 [Marchantia paleacea]